MDKNKWKRRIKSATVKAEVYKPYFDDVISTLAAILERRDEVEEEYIKLGSKPLIKYTNKGGSTNPTKNPLLTTWESLNTTALSYWRELGLTPSAYKKMTGSKPTETKKSALVEALKAIEAG